MTAAYSLLPTSANDLFKCPDKFGYFADSSDCAKYFVCVFGEALHESCTGGLYFSAELQTCDWPRNVLCLQGSSSSSVNPGNTDDYGDPTTGNGNQYHYEKENRDKGSLSSFSVFDEVDDAGLAVVDSRTISSSNKEKPPSLSANKSLMESPSTSSDYDLIADKFRHPLVIPPKTSNASLESLSTRDRHHDMNHERYQTYHNQGIYINNNKRNHSTSTSTHVHVNLKQPSRSLRRERNFTTLTSTLTSTSSSNFIPSTTPSVLTAYSAMTTLPRNIGGYNVRPVDQVKVTRAPHKNAYNPPIEAETERPLIKEAHSNKISLEEGKDDPQPPNFDAEEAIPPLIDSKGGVHFSDGAGGTYGLSGEIPGLISPVIESAILSDKPEIDSSSGYIFIKPIKDGERIESLSKMLSSKNYYQSPPTVHPRKRLPTRLPILNNPLVPAMETYIPTSTQRPIITRFVPNEEYSDKKYSPATDLIPEKNKPSINHAYIPVIDPFILQDNRHSNNNQRIRMRTNPPPVSFFSATSIPVRNVSSLGFRPLDFPKNNPSSRNENSRYSSSLLSAKISDERTAPDQISPETLVRELDHLRSQASFAMQPPMLYVSPTTGFKKNSILFFNDSLPYFDGLKEKRVMPMTTPGTNVRVIPFRTPVGYQKVRVIPRNNAKSNSFIDAAPDVFFDDDPSLGSFEQRERTTTMLPPQTTRKEYYSTTTPSLSLDEEFLVRSTTPQTNGHLIHDEYPDSKYEIDSYKSNQDSEQEVRFKENNRNTRGRQVYTTTTRPPSSTSKDTGFQEYSPYFDDNRNQTDIIYEPKMSPTPSVKPKKHRTTTTTTTTTSTTTTSTSTTPRPTRASTTIPPTTTTTMAPKKKTTVSIVRQMSAKRSRPTNKRLIVKFRTTVAPKPPSRPKALNPTPTPMSPADKCDPKVCRLPDCNCGSSTIPGGLKPKQVPQIVLITFDDAINDLNWEIYEEIFNSGRKNPNGCPPLGTFYVSHEWTDYGQVQTLYSRGHEMASHGVTHSFGEKFSKGQWMKEMQGQREILHLYGGVKLEDIRGMRAPFLQVCTHYSFNI